jgi:hypothetical protein
MKYYVSFSLSIASANQNLSCFFLVHPCADRDFACFFTEFLEDDDRARVRVVVGLVLFAKVWCLDTCSRFLSYDRAVLLRSPYLGSCLSGSTSRELRAATLRRIVRCRKSVVKRCQTCSASQAGCFGLRCDWRLTCSRGVPNSKSV